MAFVHGHARESGWVVSHYRRPQRAGDDQLPLPGQREPAEAQVCETTDSVPDDEDDEDDPDPSVRAIPRRTASTR
ncbi:hypothetical protein GCM10023199_46300 [Actinomycetospora chibensis]